MNKVYKTTSDCYQQTLGSQKSSPLSLKGGRTRVLKIEKGDKGTRDGDPSRPGKGVLIEEVSNHQETLALAGPGKALKSRRAT